MYFCDQLQLRRRSILDTMIKSILASFLLATSAVQASPALTERSLEATTNNDPFTVPKLDRNPRARAAAIEVKRKGWQYSNYPMGVAYYPTGTLANKTIAKDQESWLPPILEIQGHIDEEAPKALANINAVSYCFRWECFGAIRLTSTQKGGLNKLEDYANLYDGQWENAFPSGPFPGMLTNFTDDRLFSMMRLSASPYRIKRVKPSDSYCSPSITPPRSLAFPFNNSKHKAACSSRTSAR